MNKTRGIKKVSAVFFSLIYVQVNVAWAGIPTMPLPLQTFQLLQKLVPKPVTPVIASPRSGRPTSLSKIMMGRPNALMGRSNLMNKNVRLLRPLRGLAMTKAGKVKPEEVFIFHIMDWEEQQRELLNQDRRSSFRPAPAEEPRANENPEDNNQNRPVPEAENAPRPDQPVRPVQQTVKQQDVDNLRNAKNDVEIDDLLAGEVSFSDGKFGQKGSFLSLLDLAKAAGAEWDPAKKKNLETQLKSELSKANQALMAVGLHVDVVKGSREMEGVPGVQDTSKFHLEVGVIKAKDQIQGFRPGELRENVQVGERNVQVRNYEIVTKPVQKEFLTSGMNESTVIGDIVSNVILVNITEVKANFAQSQRDGSAFKGKLELGDFYRKTLAHEMGHALLNQINPEKLKNMDAQSKAILHEFFAMASELLYVYSADPEKNHQVKMAVLQSIHDVAKGGPDNLGLHQSPAHKLGAEHLLGALQGSLPGEPTEQTYGALVDKLNGLKNDPQQFNQFFKNAAQDKAHRLIGPEVLPGNDAPKGPIQPKDMGPQVLMDSNPVKNEAKVKEIFFGIENFGLDLSRAKIQTYTENGQTKNRLITEVRDSQGRGELVVVYQTVVNGNPALQIETTAKGARDLGIKDDEVKKIEDKLGYKSSDAAFIIFAEAGKAPSLFARDGEGNLHAALQNPAVQEQSAHILKLPVFMNGDLFRRDFLSVPGKETKVNEANKKNAVYWVGYTGNAAEIDRRRITYDPGTTVVENERGIFLVGKIRWETTTGLKFEAEGAKDGKIRTTMVATGDGPVEWTEYSDKNTPTAVTVFNKGDKEVRVNNQLIYFEANNGAILRLVFTPQAAGKDGKQQDGQQQKPNLLSGGVGDYVIREGAVDSVWKMVDNKVTLVQMKSIFGQEIARLNNNGVMEAKVEFKEGGIERKFQVLSGPTFDSNTGQGAVKINVFAQKAGETRELKIEGGGGGGPSAEATPGHMDRDLEIRLSGNGDGKFVKVAMTENAVFAATMGLSGATHQVVGSSRENIRYTNSDGTRVLAQTLDDFPGRMENGQKNPEIVMLTNDSSEKKELEKLNVKNTLPGVEGAVRTEVELKKGADGKVTQVEIKYTMANGASATLLAEQNGKREFTFVTHDERTKFALDNTTVYVPGGRNGENSVRIDLYGGFQAKKPVPGEKKGNYEHLDGVDIEYKIPAKGLDLENIPTINVSLRKNGKGEIEAVVNGITNKENFRFSDRPYALSETGAKFSEGKIFFQLERSLQVTDSRVKLAENQYLEKASFSAKYVTFGLAANQFMSAEIDVKKEFSYTQEGGQGGEKGSLSTPGAESKNLDVRFDGNKTTIKPIEENGQPAEGARVAALISEADKGEFSAQLNVAGEGADNVRLHKKIEIKTDGKVVATIENNDPWQVSLLKKGKDGKATQESEKMAVYSFEVKDGDRHRVEIDGEIFEVKADGAQGGKITIDGNRTNGGGRARGEGSVTLARVFDQTKHEVKISDGVEVDKSKITNAVFARLKDGNEDSQAVGTFGFSAKVGKANQMENGEARYNITIDRDEYQLVTGADGGTLIFTGREVRSGDASQTNNARLVIPKSLAKAETPEEVTITFTSDAVLGEVKEGKVNPDARRGFGYKVTVRPDVNPADRNQLEGNKAGIELKINNETVKLVQLEGNLESDLVFDGREFVSGHNAMLKSPKEQAEKNGRWALPQGIAEGKVTGDAVLAYFDREGKRNEGALKDYSWELTLKQDGGGRALLPLRGGPGRYEIVNGKKGDKVVYDGREGAFQGTAGSNLGIVGDRMLSLEEFAPLEKRQEGYHYELSNRGVFLQYKNGKRDFQAESPVKVKVTAGRNYVGEVGTEVVEKNDVGRATKRAQTIGVDAKNRFRLANGDTIAFTKGASVELINGVALDQRSIKGTLNVYGSDEALKGEGFTSKLKVQGVAAFVDGEGYIPSLSVARREEVTITQDNARGDLFPPSPGNAEMYFIGQKGTKLNLVRGGEAGPELELPHGRVEFKSLRQNDAVAVHSYSVDSYTGKTVESWDKKKGSQEVVYRNNAGQSGYGDNVGYMIRYKSVKFETDPRGTGRIYSGKYSSRNGKEFEVDRNGVWLFKEGYADELFGRNYTFVGVNGKYIIAPDASWRSAAFERGKGEVLTLVTPTGVIRRPDVRLIVDGDNREVGIVDLKGVKTSKTSINPTMTVHFTKKVGDKEVPVEVEAKNVAIWKWSPDGDNIFSRVENTVRFDTPLHMIYGRVVSYSPSGVRGKAFFNNGRFVSTQYGKSLYGLVATRGNSIVGLFPLLDRRLQEASPEGGKSGPDFQKKDIRYGIQVLSYQEKNDETADGDYTNGIYYELRGTMLVEDGRVDIKKNSNIQWVGGGQALRDGQHYYLDLMGNGGEIISLAKGDKLKFDSNGTYELDTDKGRKDSNRSSVTRMTLDKEGNRVRTDTVIQTASDKRWYNRYIFHPIADAPAEQKAIFIGVLVIGVLLAIPTMGGSLGGAATVSTLLFGITAATGKVAAALLIAGAALNFASLYGDFRRQAWKSDSGWERGFFWVGVGLTLLPFAGAAFKYARGGWALRAAAEANGFKGWVAANQVYDAARAVGVEGVRFLGVSKAGVEGTKDLLRVARTLGVRDLKGLANFASVGRQAVKELGVQTGRVQAIQDLARSGKLVAGRAIKVNELGIFVNGAVKAGATLDDFAKVAKVGLSAAGESGSKLKGVWEVMTLFKGGASGAVAAAAGGGQVAGSAGRTVATAVKEPDSMRTLVGQLVGTIRASGTGTVVGTIQAAVKSGQITLGQGVVVLAKALTGSGNTAMFGKLALELVAGNKVLTGLFKALGEKGAQTLLEGLAKAGQTGTGLLESLTEDGAKVLGALLNDAKGAPKVLSFIMNKPGGQTLGKLMANLFNEGGMNVATFFKDANRGTLNALARKFQLLTSAGAEGQRWVSAFSGVLKSGENGARQFAGFLNTLGENSARTFLAKIGVDGLEHTGKLIAEGGTGKLMDFANAVVQIAKTDSKLATTLMNNFAGALNYGREAGAAFIKEASTAKLIGVLSGQGEAVAGIFKGLAQGGAKAGSRLAALPQAAEILKDIPARLAQLAGSDLVPEGLAGQIAQIFGQGLAAMEDDAFKGLVNFLGQGGKNGATFIELLTFGGKEGAQNLMGFLSLKGLVHSDVRILLNTAKNLNGNVGRLLSALTGNGALNMKTVLNSLHATNQIEAAKILAKFFEHGNEAAYNIFRQMTPLAAENLGKALANMARNGIGGGNFKEMFAGVLALIGKDSAALQKFGQAFGSIMESQGARLAGAMGRLTKEGAENLGKALVHMAKNEAREGMKVLLGVLRPVGKETARVAAKDLGLALSSAGRQTVAGLSQNALGGLSEMMSGLSSTGKGALKDLLEACSPATLDDFLKTLTSDGRQAFVKILEQGKGVELGELFSLLDLRGAKNLGNLFNLIKEGQGVAFFKNLLDVGKAGRVAEFFNLTSIKSFTSLNNIISSFSKSSSAALFADILRSSDDLRSVFTFLENVGAKEARGFATFLENLGANGTKSLATFFKNLDGAGAKVFADLMKLDRPAVLAKLFNTLTEAGALKMAGLFNALSDSGRAAFASVFKGLTENGAALLGKVLNQVGDIKGLLGVFNNLTKEGVKALATLLNTDVGAAAKNLVTVMGVLTEQGGRSLAAILNKGGEVGANLASFLGLVNSGGAKIFGSVLNGVSKEGATALADAFANFSRLGVERFAKLISQLKDAGALVGLLGGLGEKGGQILSKLMNHLASSEFKIFTGMLKSLTEAGGGNLGKLLVKLTGDVTQLGAVKFIKNLNNLHATALAGFLNAASESVVSKMATLVLDGKLGAKTLAILENIGKEGGQSLARLFETAGDEGFKAFQGLLAKEGLDKVLAGCIKTMADHGAKALGNLLKGATPAELADLEAFMNLYKGARQGEILGVVFKILGEAGFKEAKFKEVLSALLKNPATKDPGLISGSILAKTLAGEAGKLTPAMANRIGKFVTDVAASSADKEFLRGFMQGLFGEAKALKEGNKTGLLKDVLEGVLGAESSLSSSQKSALRAAAKAIYGEVDELTPLFRLSNRLLNFIASAGLRRVEDFAFLINNPQKYFMTMHMTALSWSAFGFFNVGVLIPFGYDAKKDEYYWGFRDPTDPNGNRISLAEALNIVFLRWDGKYMDSRMENAQKMFSDGRRLGILLHVFAFQPTSRLLGGIARRGAIGSLARAGATVTERTLNFFAKFAPRGGALEKVLLGTGGKALALTENFNFSGLMHAVGEAPFKAFGKNSFLGTVGKVSGWATGTFIGGPEGVLPFHILSGVGTFAGVRLGKWTAKLQGLDEKGQEDRGKSWGELGGTLGMFFAPMARFRVQFANDILSPKLGGGRGPSLEARTLAESILASGTEGPREIQIGMKFMKLNRADRIAIGAMKPQAADVKIEVIKRSEQARGKDPYDLIGKVFKAMTQTPDEQRDKTILDLKNNNRELRNFDFDSHPAQERIYQSLKSATGMNDQQIAEAGLKETAREAWKDLSVDQVREELIGRETGKLDSNLAAADRTKSETEIKNKYNGMSENDARAELTKQRFDDVVSGKIEVYARDGKIVPKNSADARAGVRAGVRLTGSLRERSMAQHQARVFNRIAHSWTARFKEWVNNRLPESSKLRFRDPVSELAGSFVGGGFKMPSLISRRSLIVTSNLKAAASDLMAFRDIVRENKTMGSKVDSRARALENEVFNQTNIDDINNKLRTRPGDKLGDLGLAWVEKYGLQSLTVKEFSEIVSKVQANREGVRDLSFVLEIGGRIEALAKEIDPNNPFRWADGQLYGTIMSSVGNINMAAGGGKTAIMIVRSLIEATKTSDGSSAVFLISENPASVDNVLGKGGIFDLRKLADKLGIEVIDLRAELKEVRDPRSGKTIKDLNERLSTVTDKGGVKRRRIALVDFDTLGGALSEFKADGFLRAYTNSQVRIFDEVHRVTTDPVTYVIGGGDGARAVSKESFDALRTLEEATVQKPEDKGPVGLMEGTGKLGLRMQDGTVKTVDFFRSRAAYEEAKLAGTAAVCLDKATGEARVTESAAGIFREAAGLKANDFKGLNGQEIESFVRGRLVEENQATVEIDLVKVKLENGQEELQYRPIQRGLGVKDAQVIEDFANLIGLNARRQELHFGKTMEMKYMRDTGDIQVLETLRGISRYEFFEATGEAVRSRTFRGLTATAKGYEGFIQLATGAWVFEALPNTISETIRGLDGLRVSAGDGFYTDVVGRVVEIARDGAVVSETGRPGSGSNKSRRILVGTEDPTLITRLRAELQGQSHKGETLADRLVAKDWVFDPRTGEIKSAREAGVQVVKGSDGRWSLTGENAGKYKVIERVIDNTTPEEMIQAIVKSFQSDRNAIAISNQRGLTGKNFLREGTIILADPKVTVGEVIQNVERLGRTKKEGGRYQVRREVFMSRDFLEVQLLGAYSKRGDFSQLLEARAKANLTEGATLETWKKFMAAVEKYEKAGDSRQEAVNKVIEDWGKVINPKSSASRQGLLRLSTEFNLLERNTGVGKTVANEVFFHHDLGRALNDAFFECRGNTRDRGILENFEKDFRNERARSAEDVRGGNESVSAEEQLAKISKTSHERCKFLLSNFIKGEGRKLSRPVRQVLEAQLKYLVDSTGLEFKKVVQGAASEPTAMSFAQAAQTKQAGRAKSFEERFTESRKLISDRLKNDIAPSTDGGKAAQPRQVVQAVRALEKAGADKTTCDQFRTYLGNDPTLSYSQGGRLFLTQRGQVFAGAVMQLVDMDPDRRAGLEAVLLRTHIGGNTLVQLVEGQAGPLLDLLSDQSGTKWAIAIVQVLVEHGFINLSHDDHRDLNNLVRVGLVLDENASILGSRTLDKTELENILKAEVPGFEGMRESLAKSPVLAPPLESAQAAAPMAALFAWMAGMADPAQVDAATKSLPEFRDIQKKAKLLDTQQTKAKQTLDSLLLPGKVARTLNAWKINVADAGKAVWNWISSGSKKAIAGKAVLVGGGLIAAASFLPAGVFTLAALKIAGLVLGGIMGSAFLGSQFSARAQLARATARLNSEFNEKLSDLMVDKVDKKSLMAKLAVFLEGNVDQWSKISKAAGILFDKVKDEAPVAWSRLTLKDLVLIAGGKVVEDSTWFSMMPKVTEGLKDFRQSFRKQLAAAAKPQAEIRPWLRTTGKVVSTSVLLGGMIAGLFGVPVGQLTYGLAMGLGMVSGTNYLDMGKKLAKVIPGGSKLLGGAEKLKERVVNGKKVKVEKNPDTEIKNSFWNLGSFLNRVGAKLGIKGDKGLFDALLKFAGWAKESDAALQAESDKVQQMSMEEQIDYYQNKSQEPEEEEPVDSLANFEEAFPDENEWDQSLAAFGFDESETDLIKQRAAQINPEQRALGYDKKISLSEMSDKNVNFDLRLRELDFGSVRNGLKDVRTRASIPEGSLPEHVYQTIAANHGFNDEAGVSAVDKVKAIDRIITTAEGNAFTAHHVQVAAEGNSNVEDFLYKSLGVAPELAAKNLKFVNDAVTAELGSGRSAMTWAVPYILGVKELKDESLGDDFDAVNFVGRMSAGLMRGWQEEVSRLNPEKTQDASHEGFLRNYYRQFATYIASQSDENKTKILEVLKAQFKGEGYQVPWNLYGSPIDVESSLRGLHASVILTDLTGKFKSAKMGEQIPNLQAWLWNSPGNESVATILSGAGMDLSLLNMPGYVRYYVVDDYLKEVLGDLLDLEQDHGQLEVEDIPLPRSPPVAKPATAPALPIAPPPVVPAVQNPAPGPQGPASAAVAELEEPEPRPAEPQVQSAEPKPVARPAAEVQSISREEAQDALRRLPIIVGAVNLTQGQKFGGVQSIVNLLKNTAVAQILDPSQIGEANVVAHYSNQFLVGYSIDKGSGVMEWLPVPGVEADRPFGDQRVAYQFDVSRLEQAAVASRDQDQDKAAEEPTQKRGGLLGRFLGWFKTPLIVLGAIGGVLGGGSALQAAEVGASKAVTLASQAGAADPSGIVLLALGMAVVGLVAYKSFGLMRARRAPVTVDESAMLDVPTDRGTVKVGFAAGVADKLRAQVQAGGKTEQVLFAALEKQGQGYIVTDSVRVPQLEIIGGPRYPTQLMRELAAQLAGINPQNASAEVAALLQDRTYSEQVKNINITSIVNAVLGQTAVNIPANLLGRIQNGEAVRLGEVFAMQGEAVGEFKNFVYDLVARNGQSVAAPSGVYFSGTYLASESQKRGQILIPLHTEPVRAGQALLPSFTDRVTSWALRRFFGEKKMEYPGFLLMASQDGKQFTFFNTNSRKTLTVDENMKPVAEQPRYIPYQNIEVVMAEPLGDGKRLGILGLLPRWLVEMVSPKVKALPPNPEMMFFGEDVGNRTGMMRMANTMVNLVNEIDRRGMSFGDSKRAFMMAGFYALGLLDKGRIEVYLSQFNGSSVGLDKLIMQLGDQMKNSANPGTMKFAPHMDAVHGVLRHYLKVSAWPAEREWVIQKVNEALDLRLVDPMTAKTRADQLKRSLRGRANVEQLADPLLALAGFGQADFVGRLNDAMKGVVFETSEGVRAAFEGKKSSNEAKAVALKLLASGLLEAIIKTSPVPLPAQAKEDLFKSLNVVVKEGPRGFKPHVEGAIYKSKGLIEITLDPELRADEAFQQAVGALAHELAHAVEDFAIGQYAVGGLGIPTVISEAWAQLTASRALRFLNLNLIADVADMKTFEEIAKREEAQVGYFDLDVIKSERDVEALIQVVGVDGSRRNAPPRNAVVLGTPAEMKAKADLVSLLERAQIQVMNVDDIVKNLVPSANETPLEAHGRLFFGTRKVRLVTNKAQGEMKDSWKALLTVVGGVQSGQLVEALIATLGAASLASRLENIYQERMTDLVASRHA